ncbi:uncharacterized protein LOC130657720 [Hydractinia symbiolongicarpus]|uniref:uncharacterized protein LOC130657720 n=1 Tax=Hydractinia symbiolongicarpus TaxID=13093 RepID=UPI00254E2DBB|nr:uncharacterized protein LOC130657720 [Hydractinia symbiolongicarpus]
MEECNTGNRVKKSVDVATEVKHSDDFFKTVSIFHYICVIVGFLAFWYVCFTTNDDVFKRLGGPGQRLTFLRENYLIEMRIGFFFAILLHIVEALYAVKVGSELNLSQVAIQKWVIQTSIVGYSSLRHLTAYQEEKRKKKAK